MIGAYIQQLKTNGNSLASYMDMIWCSVWYGASPNNYANFGFKNLNHEMRSTYVTNRLSRKMIKRFNQKDYIDIFEDKTKFAERFAEYFGREWISTSKLEYGSFLEFVEGKDKFIYKPIGNAQGQGIKVFDDLADLPSVYREIQNIKGDAIIEEWINQHPVLDQVYEKAINCLRIITVCQEGKTKFLAGGVTWGNGKKIANASASGIVSPVNFETGILEKPAADFCGHVYQRHPITGSNLVGIQLPYWNDILEMLKKASNEVSQIGYVGWDIAITSEGPILIEGNTTPGYRYYQIPAHMTDKRGNRSVYESCL